MTQTQRKLYNLLVKVNKLSKDDGEPYLAFPKEAFTELVSTLNDETSAQIIRDSENGVIPTTTETDRFNPAEETDGEHAGKIEVLLWLVYMNTTSSNTSEEVIKSLETWFKFRDILSSFVVPAEGEKPTKQGRRSKTAKNYILPTGKVMSILPKLQVGDTAKVEVIHRKKSPAVHTIVQLSQKSGAVQIEGHLDAFDLSILDGVTSLLNCGNDFITADMAYRATTGDAEAKITKAQREDADKSIRRLCQIRATFDATEEAKAYRKDVKFFRFSDYLLSAKYVEAGLLNGVVVSGYKFGYEKDGTVQMPVHYQYATISNQIATIPVKLLDLPVNNTKANIVLRDYLLKMIGAMKNPNATIGNKISFASIYEVAGTATDSPTFKTEAKRVRETTFKMLDEWKKLNHIKGYVTYKKGNAIAGVQITV